MEFAYNYRALSSTGKTVNGIIYATSQLAAYTTLKKGGFVPKSVKLDPGSTVAGLLHRGFNKSELARFYITLGRRLKNGKATGEGLEAAVEYIKDSRLRQAVVIMRQALQDGQNEFTAMQTAGFPLRDTLVIQSTSETGKTGETFLSLGEELQRNEAMRRAVASTFRMPIILSIFMVIFIWAALMFIAPSTLAFLKQTGLKLNFSPMIAAYFEFVRLFHIQAILSSIAYFGVFIGIAFGIRSQAFKQLLDKSKTMRNLSMKSDHASLWNSFMLLFNASVPIKEASRIVGASANRPDSKAAFTKMGKLIEGGRSIEDSVRQAGFPDFVVSRIASAVSSGDTAEGLRDMVTDLEEDVQILTGMLQENAKMLSIVGMGFGVLLVFVMTYYPMIASVMSNL